MTTIPIHTSSPINLNHSTTSPVSCPSSASKRYTPTTSPTRAQGSSDPQTSTPPPQPGALPSIISPSGLGRPSIPPPPRVNETPERAAGHTRSSNSQAGVTPGPVIKALSSITTTTPTSIPNAASALTFAAVPNLPLNSTPPLNNGHSPMYDLSHPPGYIQNTRASFSSRAPELEPGPGSPGSGRRRGKSMSGILDGSGAGGVADGTSTNYTVFGNANGNGFTDSEEKGIWGTAVEWVQKVGETVGETVEKVVEGEEGVWRRVTGGGGR